MPPPLIGMTRSLRDLLEDVALGTPARGDLSFFGPAAKLTNLPAGPAGFVLQANGAGADPSWVVPPNAPDLSAYALKTYVDTQDALRLPLTGGTLTGALALPGNPSGALQAAPKQYVDAGDALQVPRLGGVTVTGPLTFGQGAAGAAGGAETLVFADTPPVSSTSSLVRYGAATTGLNAAGTYQLLNAPAGWTGDFFRGQVNGTDSVWISAAGAGMFAGNVVIGGPAAGARLEVDGAASGITAIFKAHVTTPGNIAEFQNSSGSILGRVDAAGTVSGGFFRRQGGNSSYLLQYANPNNLLSAEDAAHTPLVVRGAASQSADLAQWQNSSAAVLARIDSGGQLDVRGANSLFGAGIGTTYIQNDALNFYYSSNAYETGLINFRGYQAGTTQFRDLGIYDGKQNQIALFRGSGRSVIIGSAALATSATDGFLYVPSCPGVPTGVPTSYAGRVPLVYDSLNNVFYVYNSGWKGVGLS